MATALKSIAKASVTPGFAASGPDYSREISLMRKQAREVARARLLAAGFVIKRGVVRVDTGK